MRMIPTILPSTRTALTCRPLRLRDRDPSRPSCSSVGERRAHPWRGMGGRRATIQHHDRVGAGRSTSSTCRAAASSTTMRAAGFFSRMRSLSAMAGRMHAGTADGGRGERREAREPHTFLHISCGAAPAVGGGGSGDGWQWWAGMWALGAAGSGLGPGRTTPALGPRAPAAVGVGNGSCALAPVVSCLYHFVCAFGTVCRMWSYLL